MKLNTGQIEFEVRPGTVDDVPLLLSFIRAMAEFEDLEVTATEEILSDSLFGDRPAAEVLLAFVDEQLAAYAVYYFTFGTMTGKRSLWLDDIFVSPEFRKKGIAKSLMKRIAEIAVENNCGRFEWMVLDWNQTAIDLYKRMGAIVFDEWRICRLDEQSLNAVANS